MANVKLTFSTAVDLQGLQQLEKKLQEIRTMAKTPGDNILGDLSPTEISKTVQAVNTLERAIKSAYNADLNTMSVDRFNQRLKESNMTVQELRTNLAKAGPVGQQSFLILANQLTNFTKQVKYTNKFLSDMQQTFKNTITWGISSGIWNTMLSETQKAYHYVVDLDKSLNDIRIVTGKSADEMTRFAKEANKAAKELAVSTKEYTQGALIYYQQGLDNETVKTLTDITAKTSNVTGQSMETVSEQLTAVWNGYQVANQAAYEGMQVYEEYVDKMAAVGATTATDLEELATAMSKVASAANSMGVGFDELSAQIATIVSVTRQAPESVGTALKTIYARLGDLQVDGVDEFGVSLGTVSSQLKTMGVDVMDANGNMRNMDEVMTEVAGKWNTWTDAQKEAAAVAMAGKRQYNNLIALFDNWDMYGDSLKTSMEAAGTLNKQQETALESLESKMEKMTVAAEKLYDALFDEKSIGSIVDGLTGVIDLVANLTDGIGGLIPILNIVGASMIKSFGSDIGKEFAGYQASKSSKEKREKVAKTDILKEMGKTEADYAESPIVKKEVDKILTNYQNILKIEHKLTEAEKEQYQLLKSEQILIAQKQIDIENEIKEYQVRGQLEEELFASLKANEDQQQKINERISERQKILTNIADETFNNKPIAFNDERKTEATASYQMLQGHKESIEKKQEEIDSVKRDRKVKKGRMSNEEKQKLETLEKELKELEKAQGDLNKITQKSEAIVDDFASSYIKALKKVIPESEDNNELLKRYEELLKANIKKTGDFEVAVQQTSQELAKENQELLEASNNFQKYGEEMKDAEDKQKDFNDTVELEAAFSSAADAIGSCIQVATGFGMVLNSFQAASDPTKSFLENLTAGFGGLAAGLISILTGISQFKTAMDTLLPMLQPILTSIVTAFKGMAAGVTGAITSIPVIGWILGIIAAVGALIAIIVTVAAKQDKLNEAAEKADKAAEASKKITQQAKKEKEAIEEVANAYKDLQEQYEQQEISLNDLRSQTYDLCMQYGLEDLAIKALIGDYEELNELMKQQQKEKNNAVIKASKDELETQKASIQAGIYANIHDSAQETFNGKQYIDIVDGAGSEGEVKKVLSKYIAAGEFEGGWVSNEALTDALMNHYDEIYQELSTLTSDSAKHLIEAIDTKSEVFTRVKELNAQIGASTKSNISLDNTGNIHSLADYHKAVTTMSDQANLDAFDGDKNAALTWAKTEVGKSLGSDEKFLAAQYSTADKVSKETEKAIEDVIEQIKDFSQGELSYLELNIDALEAETDLKEFLKKAEYQIATLNANEEAVTIQAMVEVEGKSEFSQAEIDRLFNMDGFTEAIGKTEDEFKNMDFGAQREAVVQYYSQLQDTIKVSAAQGLEAAKAELDAAEIAYQEALTGGAILSDVKDEIFKNWNIELTHSMFAAAETYATSGEWTDEVHQLYDTIYKEFYEITGRALSMEDFRKTTERMMGSYSSKIADKKGARDSAGNTYNKLLKIENEGLRDLDLSYKKLEKHYDNEFDRFYKINKELEKYNDNLEDLSRIQKHLSGQSLIDNLKAQGKELQNQAASYDTLLKQQQAYAGELAGELAGSFGVKFNADGTITNYKEVTDKMLAWVNARGDQEADVERYEKFKEKLDQYDSLHQEMIQTANDIDNSYLEAVSANLEAWEVEIELQLDTKEAEREMLDFVHETSDNFKKAFSDIGAELSHILATSGTYTQENGTIATDIQAINDTIAEINKIEQMGDSYYTSDEAMFGSMSEAQAKLEQLQSTLLKDAKEVHQAWQDGWDAYMEGIDQASEKYEKFNEQYERINEELEYQGQLIELLYGPEAYALQGSLLTQQLNTSKSQIEFTKEQVDLWQSMYDQAEEGSEEQLKYAELLQESQSKLNDLTLAHIQLIKDEYANTVSSIIKNLENEMTNNLGFDKMREEWERALEESEKYYDSVEKIYQINSLQNKYQNAINNTSSTKYQQAISDMMADQLSMLEEKEKMTEYDVQLAEKHLSILEAEAALEDAQNAKNAMKLVRGADGNWGYQYVADTKDIEEKQQSLQDAYNDLYTFTKKAQQDAMTSLMDAKEQYLEDLQEIYMQEGVAAEEKEAQAQALYERYYGAGGTITLLNQEYEQKRKDAAYSTVTTLTGYYKTDEDAYRQMDTNERELVDKFATDTGATYAKLYADIKLAYEDDQTELETKLSENWSTWEKTANDMSAKWNSDDEDSIKTQVKNALSELTSSTEDYEKKVDEVANLVGQDFNSEEGLTGDIGAAEQKVKDLEKATEDLDDNVKTDLENFKGYVEKLEDAWELVLEDVNAVGSAIDGVKMKLDNLPPNKTVTVTYEEVNTGGGGGAVSGGGGSNYTEYTPGNDPLKETGKQKDVDPPFEVGDKVASAEQRRDGGANMVRKYEIVGNKAYLTMDWIFGSDLEGAKIAEVHKLSNGTFYKLEGYKLYYNEAQLTPFDTGGYTGEWGSSGRVAMLHQKEIVLNAKDTENLLAAVDTVRDMANISSSIGSAIMQNVRTMIFEALGIRARTVYGNGGSNNETSNVFNITAEFPNADSVATIQEAILSLPNLASQYLAENRK